MPIHYDKKTARYRGKNGQFISASSVKKQIEKVVEVVGKDMRGISQRFNEKKIDLKTWKKEMKEQIKTLHTLTASVGKGGRKSMTKSDWGKVGSEIKKQYAFLDKFASEIEKGKVTGAKLEYRASLYARAARKSFSSFEKDANSEAGKLKCRRIVHAKESCSDCLYYASLGYIDVDEMPDIGDLICGNGCKCELEYR